MEQRSLKATFYVLLLKLVYVGVVVFVDLDDGFSLLVCRFLCRRKFLCVKFSGCKHIWENIVQKWTWVKKVDVSNNFN